MTKRAVKAASPLDPRKDPGNELLRIIREDLALAISACSKHANWEKDRRAEAVRHARKAFKRIRATVDLLRDHADTSALEDVNTGVRDLGRRLSPIRDVAAIEETVLELQRSTKGKKKKRNIRIMHSLLSGSHTTTQIDHRARQDLMESVAESARTIQQNLDTLVVGGFQKKELLERIGRSWRRAQTRFRSKRKFLHGEEGFLHETRKRVIRLEQQLRVIRNVDSKTIGRMTTRLQEIASDLGKDNDLLVLSVALASVRDRFHELTPILQLESQISKKRSQLQKRAFKQGRSVLRAGGGRLGQRLIRRWK